MSSGAVTGLIILVVAAIAMVVTIAVAYGRRSEQRRGVEIPGLASDTDEPAQREMADRDGRWSGL